MSSIQLRDTYTELPSLLASTAHVFCPVNEATSLAVIRYSLSQLGNRGLFCPFVFVCLPLRSCWSRGPVLSLRQTKDAVESRDEFGLFTLCFLLLLLLVLFCCGKPADEMSFWLKDDLVLG